MEEEQRGNGETRGYAVNHTPESSWGKVDEA